MAQFTYVGEGPGTDAFGQLFPADVPVEVTDAHVINKLRGNQYFAEVFDGVEVVDALPEFVHKKRGRPPKGK